MPSEAKFQLYLEEGGTRLSRESALVVFLPQPSLAEGAARAQGCEGLSPLDSRGPFQQGCESPEGTGAACGWDPPLSAWAQVGGSRQASNCPASPTPSSLVGTNAQNLGVSRVYFPYL